MPRGSRTKPQGGATEKAKADPADFGIISKNKSYALAVFSRITGQGKAAIREARRNGLRICQSGNRSYVLGKDWHAYLEATNPPATA